MWIDCRKTEKFSQIHCSYRYWYFIIYLNNLYVCLSVCTHARVQVYEEINVEHLEHKDYWEYILWEHLVEFPKNKKYINKKNNRKAAFTHLLTFQWISTHLEHKFDNSLGTEEQHFISHKTVPGSKIFKVRGTN